MRSMIRTFVLAVFAAATVVVPHSASAQIYSHNAGVDSHLQSGGNVTVNAVIVGQAGYFTIGGQQSFYTSASQSIFVDCWMTTAAGDTLPYGLVTVGMIPSDGYVTLSFYGFYHATAATELLLVCNAPAPNGMVLSTNGNITAAYVP
jgi:hypothetical protein